MAEEFDFQKEMGILLDKYFKQLEKDFRSKCIKRGIIKAKKRKINKNENKWNTNYTD